MDWFDYKIKYENIEGVRAAFEIDCAYCLMLFIKI